MIYPNNFIPKEGEEVEVSDGFGWVKKIFYRVKTEYVTLNGNSIPFIYYECYRSALKRKDDTQLWQECRKLKT